MPTFHLIRPVDAASFSRAATAICLALAAACASGAKDASSSRDDAADNAHPSHSAETAAAAARIVQERYADHFRSGQGFSRDDLTARREWFSPRLYELMRADMRSPTDVGYLNFDPFTAAQDDASGFVIGAAKQSHDTVFVPVQVEYGRSKSKSDPPTVTLAMVPGRGSWQIANFIYHDYDLAGGLVDFTSSQRSTRR